MIINVWDLVKCYKDKVAVNGLNLQIEEGEIFGLLGPNGAGKTTTIRALLGLTKIDAGNIEIMNKNYLKHGQWIKKNIGYVPQELAFFEQLSPYDNVKYWGRIYGLRGKELEKNIKESLEFTGLWERRKEKASTFSGGMKHRLNIACGIVHKPKILFMDEPTVGVDPQSRNNILELVRTLNKEGTTVLYTSHYMEEIEAICTRIGIMDEGKMIALGTVDELVDDIKEECNIEIECLEKVEEIQEIIGNMEGVISCNVVENMCKISIQKNMLNLNQIFEIFIEKGLTISALTVEKMNLESVFLRLTGKKLRDL